MDADTVFKALGDPTRRKLLDLLCENLDMARQSATQHLGILEAANLGRDRARLDHSHDLPLRQ